VQSYRYASILISDNVPSSNTTLAVNGTGTSPVNVVLSPVTLTFPDTQMNISSNPLPVTLSNTGNGTLSISSITITGVNQSNFTQTNSCGTSVGAGASCTISVIFTPNATGARSASITISDNATPGTQTVTLSGNGTAPVVTLNPPSLTFPNTQTNTTSAPLPVTLTNSGGAPLTISSISITGANQSNFGQSNACPITPATLAAGASCTINVTFTPSATGARSANVTISDNASPATQTVTLSGMGTAPSVTLAPPALSFPDTPLNLPSLPLLTTLTNTGGAPLAISSIAITGSNATNFIQTNTCGSTVPVGGTCLISVIFTPTVSGSRTANVTVTDNASPATQTVPLSGNGITPVVTLSPTALTFPATDVNSSSAPQNATLTNTSSAPLNITSIALTGANASVYSQTNTCGTTVAAGASCIITVTFNPTSTGTPTASVTITDNASPATQTVTLTGTAVAPALTISPTSFSFGSVTDNTTAAPINMTLTNSGTGPLFFTGFAISGANAGDFAVTGNNCPLSPSSLAVNASCLITATFTPTAMGTRNATLTVSDNVPAGNKAITMTGSGIGFLVTYTPNMLSFTSTVVGATSTSKTVTLKNTGTIALNISNIQITGNNPGDFTQTSTCGASVPPSGSCVFTVYFKPTAAGSRSASLTVADNGDGSPQAVPLTGTATQGTVGLSNTSLTWTTQQYNTTKTNKETITNTGNGALTFTGFTFSGANAGDFSQTNTCPISPASLGLGKTCTVTVTFKPLGMGVRTATLNIASNGMNSPQTVALSGTGTFVKLTPTSLTFSPITVGHSSGAKTVTFTNVGNAPLTMNAISFTGTNSGDYTQTNTCGTSVAAGASCTVSVTFKPTAVGVRTANLYLDDNDGAGPQTVTLSGTGI
jgi:hypothetical protein